MTEIRNLITKEPATVDRTASVQHAAQEMERRGVGALLVMDDGRLVGIVTDRDIVLRGVARAVPTNGRIDTLMTTEVITVPAGMDVEHAHELFRDHAFRRLPVVEGRQVVGLLSVDDLLIRSERAIADLVHPLADEACAPHHEASPPAIVADSAPAGARHGAGSGGAGLEPPVRRWAVRARPGDTLVVHHHNTGQPDRTGEIFEVRSTAGYPPFAVRWSDNGHVSFIYPGPDAEIRRGRQSARPGAAAR
ncbi:signal transduction protein [Parafrankia colletiae]|uniref:Signal transduction protein n=1 Tax=Parafrankia colletiae TaxID=573497 RepID=A0A1S1RJH6_9ACTN|nr:CBS domain-containing protein [Parafrankia colletiae]MCK9899278.1 CBS domain-containing protein [Frankia sp. Cpl3]OHV45941.1 signal transduction protein [Parafrankia colletiae]